jgi:hypothetical protein
MCGRVFPLPSALHAHSWDATRFCAVVRRGAIPLTHTAVALRSAAREHPGITDRCVLRGVTATHARCIAQTRGGVCTVTLDPVRSMVGWIAGRPACSGQDCCLEPLAAVEGGSRGFTLGLNAIAQRLVNLTLTWVIWLSASSLRC